MTDRPRRTVRAPRPRSLPAERPGPTGGKRDLNRRKRLAQFASAALELMQRHGVEAVTIEQICEGAGLAKGSFYRYFSGKPALVEALFERLAEQVDAAMARAETALAAADNTDALVMAYADLAMALAPVVVEEQAVVRLYLQERRGPRTEARAVIRDFGDRLLARGEALTLAARAHGLLRDLPPAVTTRAVIGAIEAVAWSHLEGDLPGDPGALGEALISLVLEGVLHAPGVPAP